MLIKRCCALMNHRRLELTQTDSRAYINLGSLHASPHNKEALHGTWMQSRWSSRIQRTFWPKILIDSLKIIDCTNPFFFFKCNSDLSVNSPVLEIIYSSYFALLPSSLALCDVTDTRLRCLPCLSPLLNVCNGATKPHCEQEAEGLFYRRL